MSIELMTLVWQSQYAKHRKGKNDVWVKSLAKLLVMLKLADNASDEGICWPSQQAISELVGVSRAEVNRIVKELEDDSKLSIEHTRRQNKYVLAFRDLDSAFDGVISAHSVSKPDGVRSAQSQSALSALSLNHHKPSKENPVANATEDASRKDEASKIFKKTLRDFQDAYAKPTTAAAAIADNQAIKKLLVLSAGDAEKCIAVHKFYQPKLATVSWTTVHKFWNQFSAKTVGNGNGALKAKSLDTFENSGKSLAERASAQADDAPYDF